MVEECGRVKLGLVAGFTEPAGAGIGPKLWVEEPCILGLGCIFPAGEEELTEFLTGLLAPCHLGRPEFLSPSFLGVLNALII